MMKYGSQTETDIIQAKNIIPEDYEAAQWEALDFRRYQATGSLQSEGEAQGDVNTGIREERSEKGIESEHTNQETGGIGSHAFEDAKEEEA